MHFLFMCGPIWLVIEPQNQYTVGAGKLLKIQYPLPAGNLEDQKHFCEEQNTNLSKKVSFHFGFQASRHELFSFLLRVGA